MKPVDFTLHRASTLVHAVELMAEHADDAKVLAGGQSLVPLLNFRLARPGHLVDVNEVSELAGVRRDADGLSVGALVRHAYAEHSAAVAKGCPLLAEALPNVAHPPIRNRGTIGGSLAHADPAAELPTVARTVDATFRAVSVRGTRDIPAAEFFRTHLTTALGGDEILTEVRFPPPPARSGSAFLEVGRRRGDFALVGIAVRLCVDGDTVTGARVCFSGVADTPHRATCAEAILTGAPLTEQALDEAVDAARAGLRPSGDLHGSAGYRTHLAGVLLRRAARTAYERARSES